LDQQQLLKIFRRFQVLVDQESDSARVLDLFHRDCVGFANFDAALAAEAFVFIHGLSLAINDFIYVHRADIDAFGIAGALVFINGNFPTHLAHPPDSQYGSSRVIIHPLQQPIIIRAAL
jgi:hypothetical protein